MILGYLIVSIHIVILVMNNSYLKEPIIIIGTGISGISVLEELRKIDKNVPILVIDEGEGSTYLKPMLSKLCQSGFDEKILKIKRKNEIEEAYNCSVLNYTKVEYVDSKNKLVILDNNEVIKYRDLVIAMGSKPKTTANNSEIYKVEIKNVSDWKDYKKIIDDLCQKSKVAIVGSGVVGCEVAYDLSHKIDDLYLITPSDLLLSNLNDCRLSEEVEKRLIERNVNIYKNSNNIRYENTNVNEIKFETHSKKVCLTADLIIECVGNNAETDLVDGLKVNNYKINSKCKTQFNNVYALGDCASYNGHVFSNIIVIKKFAQTIALNILKITTESEQSNYPIILKIGKPILKATINVS